MEKSLRSFDIVKMKELLVGFIFSIEFPVTPPLIKKSSFDKATTDEYNANF